MGRGRNGNAGSGRPANSTGGSRAAQIDKAVQTASGLGYNAINIAFSQLKPELQRKGIEASQNNIATGDVTFMTTLMNTGKTELFNEAASVFKMKKEKVNGYQLSDILKAKPNDKGYESYTTTSVPTLVKWNNSMKKAIKDGETMTNAGIRAQLEEYKKATAHLDKLIAWKRKYGLK